jgi:hypothetical protein
MLVLGLRRFGRDGARGRQVEDRLLHDAQTADRGKAEEGVDPVDDLAGLMLQVQRSRSFTGDDQCSGFKRIVFAGPARPGDSLRPAARGEPRADNLVPGLDKRCRQSCLALQHRIKDRGGEIADRTCVFALPFAVHETVAKLSDAHIRPASVICTHGSANPR